MLAATGVKMSGSEKKREPEHTQKKIVTGKFLEVSRCIRSKQRQRNVQKERAKLFFAN